MSLKLRLVLIPAVILALGLAATIGNELAWAPQRVRAEVTSGMRLGRLLVTAALVNARNAASTRAAFDGLAKDLPRVRHIVFRIVTHPGEAAIARLPNQVPDRSGVPLWFAHIFDIPPRIETFPITVRGREVARIAMVSNPLDEIGEIWEEVFWLGELLLGASAAIVVLILWTVNRALRPVRALQDGFDRLERGDYSARLAPIPVTELTRIGEQFNSLAQSLGQVTDDNHRLIDALIDLQEAERKEIAHELHDEFGPVLFGIRAEAASILSNCRGSEATLKRIAERARAIGDLVDGIQRTHARILARLRPLALDQLGLAEALRELVAAWQERCPDIAFSVRAEEIVLGSEATGLALYRVVQECLTNAARHARARRVEVCLERMANEAHAVRVLVRDDGCGLPPKCRFGFGLLGMTERVRALNGRLCIGNRPTGGTEIAVMMDVPQVAAE
ncbi:MAG TPA: ATP-binding protein [Acetobacteraceae bacterium]|nr:ATP-binding protein [Acetobacteraceae bacterium]